MYYLHVMYMYKLPVVFIFILLCKKQWAISFWLPWHGHIWRPVSTAVSQQQQQPLQFFAMSTHHGRLFEIWVCTDVQDGSSTNEQLVHSLAACEQLWRFYLSYGDSVSVMEIRSLESKSWHTLKNGVKLKKTSKTYIYINL